MPPFSAQKKPVERMLPRNSASSSDMPAGTGSVMWSANGTRIRSAWPPGQTWPQRPPNTARSVVVHWVGSFRWHHSQRPHETENGASTRSPGLTFRTSGPASSTTPMNSWPITAPGCTSAPPRPWYWCRSDPQTALVVIRSTTSVGWTIFGSATVSTRTSPTPRNAIALLARLLRSPVVSRRMPPAPLLEERQGRGPAHARALVAGHDRDPGRRERGREGVRAGRFEDAGFARGERGGHAPGDDHHLGIQAVNHGAKHRAQRLDRKSVVLGKGVELGGR